jgi:hypothetical protein
MATLDTTSASSVLKTYYSNQRVTQMMYKDAPLYALLPKVKDFYGKIYPLPMRVTNPQGRSATFSNAQAQKTASVYKDFQLTRAKDYSLASIDSETWMASETNPGAFLKLATAEIDGALDSLKRSLAWSLYGDGAGAIGDITAATSITSANPAVITLKNAEDIVKFEVGQLLQARNGASAKVFATAVTTATVVAVDRDAGTITTDVDNSGNTDTLIADTTLNVVGDYNVKLKGLAAWIPATAPTATSFFGVDRSVDVTRLGGVRVTSTGKPLDEAYIDAARRIGREGASPDYGFCGFSRYASLEKTLGSRVIYDDVEVAGVGFRGIKISGPNKPITIIPDRDCPDAKSYLLTMDSLGLYSLKEPVMLLDLDGNRVLREGTADSYEVRCATYSQMGCDFPGANAVMLF